MTRKRISKARNRNRTIILNLIFSAGIFELKLDSIKLLGFTCSYRHSKKDELFEFDQFNSIEEINEYCKEMVRLQRIEAFEDKQTKKFNLQKDLYQEDNTDRGNYFSLIFRRTSIPNMLSCLFKDKKEERI
jgi:hypothetical protein